jgi:hypothetical protein
MTNAERQRRWRKRQRRKMSPLMHRKHASDSHATPKSLVWALLATGEFDDVSEIWEPAAGQGAIAGELVKVGFHVKATDIITGTDFLTTEEYREAIITNPPFSLWDEFVAKARCSCDKWAFIGKLNYMAAYQRSWHNLKALYVFNRQVDYRTPLRHDGLFHTGGLVTGWYIFDRAWRKDYWITRIIDVQAYAKLGQHSR